MTGRLFIFLSFCILFPISLLSANGYNALTAYGKGFVAVGTNGRVDWLLAKDSIEKTEKYCSVDLKCILAINESVVIAGDSGNILLSIDKSSFEPAKSPISTSIFTLAYFQHKILAGSEQGVLLVGPEVGLLEPLQLPLMGNIVSLSANATDCYGVTDRGEIIHSKDGTNWSVLDFNEFYKGYYKPCNFTCVYTSENQISVAGVAEDGLPVLFLSSQGNVWTERVLNFTNEQGASGELTSKPTCLLFDYTNEQIVLGTDKGELMFIPSCSHCNKIYQISPHSINALAGKESNVMAVGSNFSSLTFDTSW